MDRCNRRRLICTHDLPPEICCSIFRSVFKKYPQKFIFQNSSEPVLFPRQFVDSFNYWENWKKIKSFPRQNCWLIFLPKKLINFRNWHANTRPRVKHSNIVNQVGRSKLRNICRSHYSKSQDKLILIQSKVISQHNFTYVDKK